MTLVYHISKLCGMYYNTLVFNFSLLQFRSLVRRFSNLKEEYLVLFIYSKMAACLRLPPARFVMRYHIIIHWNIKTIMIVVRVAVSYWMCIASYIFLEISGCTI